ncbi:MAG: DUF6199 family natural product biosynthesis protein [Oscillospiraceae bacterium]
MIWLWPLLLLALGLCMMIKPELLWKAEHLFSTKGGEPTEVYLVLMRLVGVIFTAIALFMVMWLLLYDKL